MTRFTTLPSAASHSPGFEQGQEGGPETQSVHSVLPGEIVGDCGNLREFGEVWRNIEKSESGAFKI